MWWSGKSQPVKLEAPITITRESSSICLTRLKTSLLYSELMPPEEYKAYFIDLLESFKRWNENSDYVYTEVFQSGVTDPIQYCFQFTPLEEVVFNNEEIHKNFMLAPTYYLLFTKFISTLSVSFPKQFLETVKYRFIDHVLMYALEYKESTSYQYPILEYAGYNQEDLNKLFNTMIRSGHWIYLIPAYRTVFYNQIPNLVTGEIANV